MSEGTTPPKDPARDERVNRLISMAVELTGEVEELARESGTQFTSLARTARKNRIMIWTLMASLALDVLITVVLTLIGITAVDNTKRLNTITDDLATQQTESRRRALCPLYGIFLDSKSEAGRERAPDPEKYDHAFEVIEEGYLFLGCDGYLRESGKNEW